MKFSRVLQIIFFISILYFGVSNASFAAEPVIFFSDLTDGPISGWEGSTTKGAAVSIWGFNLGTNRGASYVTIGGVNLIDSSSYAEWGATINPTTARGLQRITFWLNSSMTLGQTTISVTTSVGTSQAIPFFTRNTGNIYFVARNGNDSNSGVSTSLPWLTWTKVRTTASAGDVIYFRSGTWTEIDAYNSMLYLPENGNVSYPFKNGSLNNSISACSYPGEVAQMGDGSTIAFMYRDNVSGTSNFAYWTFSKFKFIIADSVLKSEYGVVMSDDHIRWIGLDYTTIGSGGQGYGYAFSAYMNMSDYRIYGCYAHDCGQGDFGSSMYFGGGQSQLLDIGWNEFTTSHRQIQFYGHHDTDYIENLYFHDNYVHDNHRVSVMMGGGDPNDGNDYAFVKNGYIYNNIIAYNQGEMRIADGTKGAHGNFYVYNNTFYNNALEAGTDREFWVASPDYMELKNNIIYAGSGSSGGYFTYYGGSSANITGDHNCWYGQGSGPNWDHNSYDDVNPMFVENQPNEIEDYRLKDTSTLKNSGLSIGFFNTDFFGVRRPAEYSIGAIELSDNVGIACPISLKVIPKLN